jgi:hypothetical protein
VKSTALVADGPVVHILCLARAELAEVLRSLRNDVRKELHLDTSERLTLERSVMCEILGCYRSRGFRNEISAQESTSNDELNCSNS